MVLHRLGDDQRCVRPEVPVRKAVHESVAQRVEQRRRSGLWDARAAVARRGERRHGNIGEADEGRVRRRRPVDVEPPCGNGGVRRADPDDVVRLAGGRCHRAIEVGCQQAAGLGGREALLRRCEPGQHRAAVECTDRRIEEGAVGGGELVVGDVVGVGPDREFRVVGKLAERERVPVPCAGRVAGARDGDALVEGAAGYC